MLLDLASPEEGSTVELTLTFENAGELVVTASSATGHENPACSSPPLRLLAACGAATSTPTS